MSGLLRWLEGGDLRSDGMAGEVAGWVLGSPPLLQELLLGLSARDDVVRGRTADALEKVSRERPDLLRASLPILETAARQDPIPMVRWHMAMTLTSMAGFRDLVGPITRALLHLLKDESAFVRSWAATGLCVVARTYPKKRPTILRKLASLQTDKSIAVRVRARKAVVLVLDDHLPMPAGWVKSKSLRVG